MLLEFKCVRNYDCTAHYADNSRDENGNKRICGRPIGAHPREAERNYQILQQTGINLFT